MGSPSDIPGDVISMSSGDDEPSISTKRRREDASDDDGSSLSGGAPVRSPKRVRKSSSAQHSPTGQVSEEGEIDEGDNGPGDFIALSEDSDSDVEKSKVFGASKAENATSRAASVQSVQSVQGESSSAGAFMPENPPIYSKGALSLKLAAFSERREGSWFSRFKDWTQVFFLENAGSDPSRITPSIVLGAYITFIDQHSRLKPAKKKGARQAANKLESQGGLATTLAQLQSNYQTYTSREVEQPLVESQTNGGTNGTVAPPPPPQQELPPEENDAMLRSYAQAVSTAEGGTVPAVQGESVHHDDSDEQRRYFPSAPEGTPMCLQCGREGHTAVACSYSCRFCHAPGHWDFLCPSIQMRCDKCRQIGHETSGCIEKLALTKDEGLACSLCGSQEHLEGDCTDVWRSFHPDEQTIKKVSYIPASCAICGSQKHFSADCKERRGHARNPTWSLRNRDQYVDSTCGVLSINEAGRDTTSANKTRAPEVKIRGHAARTTNVHYSESDDSDVEFLSKRHKPQRAPLGQIRMSSNIQLPREHTDSGRSRNNQGSRRPALPPPPAQPPISHPPPPGVPSYGSRVPVAPPSLPARPPPRDYHSVPPPPPPPPQLPRENDRGGYEQGGAPFGKKPGRGRGGQSYRGGRGAYGGGRGGGRGRGRGRGRGN